MNLNEHDTPLPSKLIAEPSEQGRFEVRNVSIITDSAPISLLIEISLNGKSYDINVDLRDEKTSEVWTEWDTLDKDWFLRFGSIKWKLGGIYEWSESGNASQTSEEDFNNLLAGTQYKSVHSIVESALDQLVTQPNVGSGLVNRFYDRFLNTEKDPGERKKIVHALLVFAQLRKAERDLPNYIQIARAKYLENVKVARTLGRDSTLVTETSTETSMIRILENLQAVLQLEKIKILSDPTTSACYSMLERDWSDGGECVNQLLWEIYNTLQIDLA